MVSGSGREIGYTSSKPSYIYFHVITLWKTMKASKKRKTLKSIQEKNNIETNPREEQF